MFELGATLRGRALRIAVRAATIAGMGWVPDRLGAGAIELPGMGTRDHAPAAIQFLSGDVTERFVGRSDSIASYRSSRICGWVIEGTK